MVYGTAYAQAEDRDTTAKHFLIKASITNLHEISSGQLASQKATDPDVKSFGKQMVNDHTKAQTQLLQVAKSKGISLPPEATAEVAPDMMLKNASGQQFDRMYVHMMVAGHGEAVKTFEQYAAMGKDPDVKNFAQQTLPTLKEHKKMVTTLDDKVKNLSAK